MLKILLVSLLWVVGLADVEAAISYQDQRIWFQQAKTALNAKDMATYQQLYRKLEGYPLKPYLDIWQVRERLVDLNDRDVIEALKVYSDIPESEDLRRAWLEVLAVKEDWEKINSEMDMHPSFRRALPEISMLALWHQKRDAECNAAVSSRWLAGKHMSVKLHMIEKSWQAAGHPTISETKARILSLAKQGQWQKVHALALKLSKKEKNDLQLWQTMQSHSQDYLADWSKYGIEPWLAKDMLFDGFTRVSRKDAEQAWLILQEIRKVLSVDAINELEKEVALRAARQHVPQAAVWLAGLDVSVRDNQTREWQTRIRLMNSQWQEALASIADMSSALQEQSNWLYWKAYALNALGQQVEAESLFQSLASERGYYSFLAAERSSLPYQLRNRLFAVDEQSLSLFRSQPAIVRAGEWVKLGEEGKAIREWSVALSAATAEQWLLAMHVASQWQWHDQAIRAAWKAEASDALLARFPVKYANEVNQAAKASGLDESLIWSVIRQESAFNAKAISSVGARGLMQLMPRTASQVARKYHVKSSVKLLLDPENNIRLGAHYLADMKSHFDDSIVMALAAYNAGPRRVEKWNERMVIREAPLWVELIPFDETRRYVQQIMAFITVYDWMQDKSPTSMLARMRPSPEL
ncbi:MAG: lytic murein transglycosylase [Zetaproteobacteria bacterium CG_4_9_14_3_um_filter_49_83]|nr:MAG: hypothetical protein AUJ56_09110 [Zetaproteobacteria bacterium CG1_02_49_23]PIQ34894.1 MAG: lytic murein transglycosylase [Zetaproteobacteria bacterium CG17_big_fil_post_rev_8_21_14_2_50_50_13]PIV30145.1 MAG: lytic murein transglycosylase [Zetaproteobacteria bacterium CG02_land_8_20_14_3_00_50_9]PIY55440.1 MAG: lytic murein transglycosylase [Zetaproteobacteria bacterium CG_4_10_14_0_8_um_filter_49_80]PJA35179.1 MAG: lytic murein transglycosylase [Zetaproteobacteria bacterium CG_4_9_14_3